jgi:hypothetical protein
MKGLEWGRLYELYHSKAFDAAQVDAEVTSLLGDPAVVTRKGVYEYVLGGKTDHKLLSIRSSTTRPRRRSISSRPRRPRARASPTARCARLATTPTRPGSTSRRR